jgi:hypothetical protein
MLPVAGVPVDVYYGGATYMRVPGLADRIGNPRLGHPTPERLIGGERRTVEGSYADIYCTLVAQL